MVAGGEKEGGRRRGEEEEEGKGGGGMKRERRGSEMEVAVESFSSLRERTSTRRTVAVGEVGLTGRLRSVPNADKIIVEAERLGYEKVILPTKNAEASKSNKVRLCGADNVRDAIKLYLAD